MVTISPGKGLDLMQRWGRPGPWVSYALHGVTSGGHSAFHFHLGECHTAGGGLPHAAKPSAMGATPCRSPSCGWTQPQTATIFSLDSHQFYFFRSPTKFKAAPDTQEMFIDCHHCLSQEAHRYRSSSALWLSCKICSNLRENLVTQRNQ